MKQRQLGSTGKTVPVVGQGTFGMGEDPATFNDEVAALRYGFEQGLTLVDTAERYADGGSEKVVGEAVKDCREDVCIVTKVWPNHAQYDDVLRAAENSVKRLGDSYIDVYLLHWPSQDYPLEGTMRAMAELVRSGVVRHIGVSNFTPELLDEAQHLLQDHALAVNQVLYHLKSRNIENDVIPYSDQHQLTIMAYSPLGKGAFAEEPESVEHRLLAEIGERYDKSPYQVALNWVLRQPSVIAIPKASKKAHIKANAEAVGWELSEVDVKMLDNVFPRPKEGMPLKRL